jgi:hypothetical protein
MIKNEIDDFRNKFFESVIQAEKKKENDIKLKQSSCVHKYDILGSVNSYGYQERTCSKCGHTTIKSTPVWNNYNSCILS